MVHGPHRHQLGVRRNAPCRRASPIGHLPSKRLGVVPTRATLSELKSALLEAIEVEDYARAANIRDEIRQLPDQQEQFKRAELKAQLEQALKREDYQAAASVRDQLALLPPEPSTTAGAPASHVSETVTNGVFVRAISAYVPQRSDPSKGRFFFVYKICIENRSDRAVHLRNRRWIITNAQQHVEEVRGPGVIGQQPVLHPGKKFEYMSACPLTTASGSMEGEFECQVLDEEGDWVETLAVKIGLFMLTTRVVANDTLAS